MTPASLHAIHERAAVDLPAAEDAARALLTALGIDVAGESLGDTPRRMAAMYAEAEPYDRLPYFFSDQYDLGLEHVGRHDPRDELVVHGSLADACLQAFWVAPDGRVSAGMHVTDGDAIGPSRERVERRSVLA